MILSTVEAGSRASIPLVFIIDNIDLFCDHHRQILLYNLFNVVMEGNIPVALIGLTTRIVSICIFACLDADTFQGLHRSARKES